MSKNLYERLYKAIKRIHTAISSLAAYVLISEETKQKFRDLGWNPDDDGGG